MVCTLWNWDSFCTFLPFSLLKSNEVSRMEKSVWNGAICSLRIRRCLMRNNWPSISVWKKKKTYLITFLLTWNLMLICVNVGEYWWGAIGWLCNAHGTTPLTWAGVYNFYINQAHFLLMQPAHMIFILKHRMKYPLSLYILVEMVVLMEEKMRKLTEN